MKKYWMAGVLLLALSACTRGETKEQAAEESAQPVAAVNEVTVRTRDFVFLDLPDTLPAGATNFKLLNDGPDLHHVWLVRLEEGKTIADLMQAFSTGHGALPAWAVDAGGPNTPVPGETTAAIVDLEPGSYAIICVIPAKDGVPHVMKGMVRGLTVVPNTAPAPLPKANVVLTLKDYSFEFDRPVARGVQTIRVENAAQQSHEVVLLQLAPGATVQDFMTWFERGQKGAPPAKPIGGTTGFAPGEVNVITHDFAPGNYGMICFVPDAKDGKAHVAHGMIAEFTVTE